MNPRKSSTSSGRPPRPRARYLGVEVAGEPVPFPPPSRWVGWLHEALANAGTATVPFRVIRTEGTRAVVRVAHTDAGAARHAWNAGRRLPEGGRLRTRRTWGTLVGAKRWLGSGRSAHGQGPRRADRR